MVKVYNAQIKDERGRRENIVLQAPNRVEAKLHAKQWAGEKKRVVKVSRF